MVNGEEKTMYSIIKKKLKNFIENNSFSTIPFLFEKLTDILKKRVTCANPIYVQIEATTYCNLKCRMCIRNEKVKEPKHLSFNNFKKIYDQIKPLKLTLSGQGEPTLNPDLAKMIGYAKQNKSSVMIPTNGTILEQGDIAEELVMSGLDTMKISIDSATAKTFLAIRGQDCFDKIISGIKKINQIKKDNNMEKPEIRFDIVLLEENITEIENIIELATFLKIKVVYFRALQAEGLDNERKEKLGNEIDFEEMQEHLRCGDELALRLGIKTNLSDILLKFQTYKSIYIERDAKMQEQICLLPYLQCFISVDGNLSPCCALACNENFSVGNALEQDFQEVWNGRNMKLVRKMFKEKNAGFNVCKDCIPRSFQVLLSMSKMLPGFMQTKIKSKK